MPLYLTRYPIVWPGSSAKGSVMTTLFARDYIEAGIYCRERGMGEELVNPVVVTDARTLNHMRPEMPSDLLRRRRYADAHHAATFLSFVGLKSGYLNVDELLGDVSPVHTLAHWVMFKGHAEEFGGTWAAPDDAELERTADWLERLERRVPGYHPNTFDDSEPKAPPLEDPMRIARMKAMDVEALAGFASDYPTERRIIQRQRKKREAKIARLENA
ncbi:hypothetical protein HOT99_gp121 [Caulobacter phage CcrBL10]|uniref:Uncharacterized protein n=1 Tax=Caulobacter phage CcrBL10 TaxID=2283269 RepID=A0A385E9U1_9CAUD|nr:hypothetical protein HOT99_gp121 [Caulobacter phage CcrBL10]AXQ68496.1 hypothetical protein CcrBL10_gp292 [Caulobacter phage CcrBL10]